MKQLDVIIEDIFNWWDSIDWNDGFAQNIKRVGLGLGVLSVLGVFIAIFAAWIWTFIILMILGLAWAIGLLVDKP